MMATAQQIAFVSEEEYLEGEKIAALKHEYVDGHIYAMAGAHSNHNVLSGNVHGEFRNHLKGKPCRAYMSDMKVRIANGSKYYYPDVLVNCPPVNGYFTETPTIIVEVLSSSTRRTDETEKRLAYMQIETLEEYVLIAQDFVQIEVIRKNEGWKSAKYFLGDEVIFTSIGLTLSVEEIYDGVDNADMMEWLKQKGE
jgi:Uma2 family endonuclease